MEQKQLEKLQDIKIPFISRCFSVLVALLPILASYASGIPGFSVADISLALFVGLAVLTNGTLNQYKVKIDFLILGLFLIVLFSMIACLAEFPSSVYDVAIRTIRYSFYIITLFTAGKKFIDIPTLKKAIKNVSYIGSIFIILQSIIYYSNGIVIKGYLPFLNLYVEQYGDMDYAATYKMLNMYRPTSFFLEPAHYARYCLIGVILYLFDNDTIADKTIVHIIVCIIGIILSTSSQGYALMAIIMLTFLFKKVKQVKSKIIKCLMVFIVSVIVIILMKTPLIIDTFNRTFSGNVLDQNTASGARLSGFYAYMFLPLINKLIGTGFGNVPDGIWLSSAAYWLYGSGIIVFIIYMYFLTSTFLKLDRVGRYIMFVVGFLFFTDDSFYSYMIVVYFSLILFKPKGEDI